MWRFAGVASEDLRRNANFECAPQFNRASAYKPLTACVVKRAPAELVAGTDICEWLEKSLNEIAKGADPKVLRVNPQ